MQARKFAETDDHPHPVDEPGRRAGNVVSLTERRLARLPADTRPPPSVAAYDQLLRHHRTAEGVARRRCLVPVQRTSRVTLQPCMAKQVGPLSVAGQAARADDRVAWPRWAA